MKRAVLILAAMLLVLGGCGSKDLGGGPGPDADPNEDDSGLPDGDAGIPGDGGPANQLCVRFELDGESSLPQTFGGDTTITYFELTFLEARVVGDTAGFDNPDTVRANIPLLFPDSTGAEPPAKIDGYCYAAAPFGLYSLFNGTVASYEIRGTYDNDGSDIDFTIIDAPPDMRVAPVVFNGNFEPGSNKTLEIDIDYRDAIDSINWVAQDDGVVIDLGDIDSSDFREKFENGFEGED